MKQNIVAKLVPKPNAIMVAVEAECLRYERQAAALAGKAAIDHLCNWETESLEIMRDCLYRTAHCESRMEYVESREIELQKLIDENMFMLQQINKGLHELGKPLLRFRKG